ncbi:MAG: L-threonylcarbamoyladenylate synthase [Lachnospiraceae bacterium]|nr:L-threonylcarbamoyladenylate synthase [Lachnospiraceae bacterium]
MDTKIIKIDPENIDIEKIREAGDILKKGGLVAFPTETVYGLGGDACDAGASEAIYAAKGRPSDNPLIVHICDYSQLESIAADLPPEAKKLSDAFWPGPMTLIVNKNEMIPHETTGGLDTVAVRFPSHPIANALIRESGCMIAAPSANTSGRPSPTKAEHVIHDLNGKIDAIIDGGSVQIGLESTIVDLTEGLPTILRPGYINKQMLEEVVGEVKVDPGILGTENVHVRPKAPGMRYKHYAPKGDLKIVSGEPEKVIAEINRRAAEGEAAGKKVGIIATDETKDLYKAGHVISIGDRTDEYEIAHNLFDVLRRMDEYGAELIFSEEFSTPKIGNAIMNRLLKAAAHQVIEV